MSDWSKVTRPVPVPNEWTRPFWEAARRDSLELHGVTLRLLAPGSVTGASPQRLPAGT